MENLSKYHRINSITLEELEALSTDDLLEIMGGCEPEGISLSTADWGANSWWLQADEFEFKVEGYPTARAALIEGYKQHYGWKGGPDRRLSK